MTYRCVDCVYSEILDKKSCEMKCLKYDKNTWCMKNCCDELILKPPLFISHLIYAYRKKHERDYNWSDCDKEAEKILKEHGFYGMIIKDKENCDE